MHIVLDLDETLIHTQIEKPLVCDFNFTLSGVKYYSTKRPGLSNFLNFAFGHFESVNIWTAATTEYAQKILEQILTKQQQESLYIIYTRNDLKQTTTGFYKPLTVMFSDMRAKNINMRSINTIMIDDREDVMIANRGNGILVTPWVGQQDDIILYQLVIVLKIMLDNGLKMSKFNKVIKLNDIVN
jgi:TFIIF-interacting CTD phosphatase-like protein